MSGDRMNTLTNKEIAAANAQMDHESICWPCAKRQGGECPSPMVVSSWIGTCMLCGEATSCCSVRDFRWPGNLRPRGRQS